MKLTHTVLSPYAGRYLSFPDVARAQDGTLIAVFRDADAHCATECRLMLARSADNGATWSKAEVLDSVCGHMPRITTFPDGRLAILDDGAPPNQELGHQPQIETRLFLSEDDGETFSRTVLSPGTARDIPECPTFAPDRILPLSENEWIVLAQLRLGRYEYNHSFAIFVYRTTDGGKNWHVEEMAACDLSRRLTEASMLKMPDGSLLAFYRDNELGARTQWNRGGADGCGWSALQKAPFCGQRPTAGLLSDGRLLITYRKTDPPCGTAAWVGTFEQLVNGDRSGEFMLMPVSEEIFHGDMGYTGWVETAPGKVCVVFHHADTPHECEIRCVCVDWNN